MAWSSNRFCDFGPALKDPSRGQQMSRNKGPPPAFNPSVVNNNSNTIFKLESLKAGTTTNIIGIILAKESPKSIFSRKNPGTERYLMSFVVRDSPTCFVNATCWGSENYIKDLSRSFGIGDTVTISNAQVQTNPTDGSEEKFRVSTPLPFHLTLSENHSSITLYDGLDLGGYSSLQYIPIKPNSDFYTLEDVLANGQSLEGEHINLLVAVRKLGPAKDITTKTGKHTKRCELKLFDESCSSFPLILDFKRNKHELKRKLWEAKKRWGEDIVDYALSWIPMDTVLFVADVRINFDNYRQSMIATSDSKTVFTPNPDTVEGQCLYQFARTQNFSNDEESKDQSDPPLDQIKDVVTIEEAVNRKPGMTSDYAIIYGVITSFDLDSENTERFFRTRCTKCKQIVAKETGYQCVNTECTQGALSLFNANGEVSVGKPESEFSLHTSIADHTGSITQCRLNGTVIEEMLGWNYNDLVQLEVERRTDLKWNYLLERCKFYVKIIRNFQDPQKVSLKILSCSRADPAEMEKYFRSA